jgi:hypothetical protein
VSLLEPLTERKLHDSEGFVGSRGALRPRRTVLLAPCSRHFTAATGNFFVTVKWPQRTGSQGLARSKPQKKDFACDWLA